MHPSLPAGRAITSETVSSAGVVIDTLLVTATSMPYPRPTETAITANHGSPTAAARAITLNMRAPLVDGFRRRAGTAESRLELPLPTPRHAQLPASLAVGG